MTILAIRSFALLLPLLGTAVAWLWLQPARRRAGAVYLATLWTLPSLVAVHVLARSFGWWTFHFEGADFLGMPVDLLFGWALLWGALPALLMIRVPLPLSIALMIALDLVFMRSEEHTSDSSHLVISYAVFCLKKKKIKYYMTSHKVDIT